MSKHSFGNQRQRFSIRKFSVGVASVLVGMAIFGAQTAHAEENQSAELVLETPVEKSDGAAEELTVPVDKENVNEDDIAAKPIPVVAASSVETPAEMTTEADYTRRAGHLGAVTSVEADATNANVFNVTYETGQKGQLSFYNDHVVRYHVVEGNAEFKETPEPSRADRPASIVTKALKDYPTGTTANLTTTDKEYTIQTDRVELRLNKEHSLLTIVDRKDNKVVVKETAPIEFAGDTSTQTLASDTTSQYFGGGTQNGRFTHKGEVINIVNENKWTDKGVASPNPFYWTTQGYGVLRHTFKPGQYDFEKTEDGKVITKHADRNFDAFYFINDKPEALLKDYYELTGKPVVLPIFALYEGHLNAYNRDYWVEVQQGTPGAIFFEEKGKWYKEYQPSALGDKKGIRETLHAEKTAENYPFTATAVLDRYIKNDMPIGWILVNDGYGAGYGQTDTLEGNIENLKKFSEEALKKGIKTGLWTQSDLHPKEGQPALLQRDLPKEVKDAMVRILKTDVAWVGPGYSFGLNGIADAAKIMTEQGQNARPFIITLDGWGGTQRHGGIWTGDQTGGQWEYIRFHIPTYIGTGLSGQPNVSSDMDGIFGGGNKVINVRDHQWKVFTPMMLQMDGWGRNPKNPYAFDQTSTDINRTYLKMKAALVPYAYSISHEAREGKPVVRAMFLEFPDQDINYTKAVQYQFMYGENFLVAPVYENVKGDANGNDVRNGIYLPEGAEWIDYFTGEIYKGGQTLNDFDAPIWKLPIFVKNGAIIPITKEHNNYTQIDHGLRQVDFYPHGSTKFTLVEDDGLTEDYTKDKVAKTEITSQQKDDLVLLNVARTTSNYDGFVKEKATQFNVNVSREPETVGMLIDKTTVVNLRKVSTLAEFEAGENVYFYDATPNLNRFATKGGEFASVDMTKNPVLRVKSAKLDVTQHSVSLAIKGFANDKMAQKEITSTSGQTPTPTVVENSVSPTSLTVTWDAVPNAETYDIEVDGVLNTNLKEPTFKHKEQAYGSEHTYRVRARMGNVATEWSDELIARTSDNPLVNAIDDIKISSNREAQGGTPHKNLVDKDESTTYHSKWSENAIPEYLRLDLGNLYDLDKLEYLPRQDGGANGIITSSKLYYSVDGNNWRAFTQPIRWARNSDRKAFEFPEATKARYLILQVDEAVGNFVSGQELLVFKKEGTAGRMVGDVTGDGEIDQNDVVSLTNYAGLRRNIDSDFKGYVEVADLNENGVIDAYDTYYVTRQLGDGVAKAPVTAAGHLAWTADKEHLTAGEEVTISLTGHHLTNVEGIYANYPIDAEKYEVVGKLAVDPGLDSMTNFSLIRTHGDHSQEAFVVLSNNKTAPSISGDRSVASFKLRSKVAQDLALPQVTAFVLGSDMKQVDATTEVPEEAQARAVEASRISVSGKDVYQSGRGLDNLIDNNPATLTELKWNYEPNFVNGVLPAEITLPQDIQFDFDKSQPTLLESMVIRKRTPGNGTVSKYKVTAYRGDEVVYASEEMPVDFATAEIVHNFDKVRQVDRVVLTVLEAKTNATTVNNRMMTLKDVVFYEKPSALVAEPISGDKLTITGAGVYQAGHDVDKLIDGNEASLTELKWDISNNHVNGKLPAEVSLPQDITITPKDGGKLYLTGYELTKRTPGNGTVTKYKVSVYNGDDLVLTTNDVDVPFAEAKSARQFDEPLVATKVVLTVLEARQNATTINNQMMTLKEFKLFGVDPDLLPAEEEETVEVSVSANPPTVDLPAGEIVETSVSVNPPTVDLPTGEVVETSVSVNPPTVDLPTGEIVETSVSVNPPTVDLPTCDIVETSVSVNPPTVDLPTGDVKSTYSRQAKNHSLPATGDTANLALWLVTGILGSLGLARFKKED